MRAKEDPIGKQLDSILTSYDTAYSWNYTGSKQGLRELYEKAKLEQWDGVEALPWDTSVDPELEILPLAINPLAEYGPFRRLSDKEQRHYQHGAMAINPSLEVFTYQTPYATAATRIPMKIMAPPGMPISGIGSGNSREGSGWSPTT